MAFGSRLSVVRFIVVPLACAAALPAQGVKVDWAPTASEVVLNTDVARIVTSAGPMTIRGGVFVFRNVTISLGTRVRGGGSNPLIFILAGKFQLDGELTLRGDDGHRVDALRSANFPAPGGRGVCGGGDGGAGSPDPKDRSFLGQAGYGPLQIPSFGGGGGGAGGLIALYTKSKLDIEVQGETYANNDYSFPVSADGGVGQTRRSGARPSPASIRRRVHR